jgi:hypothetical protein
MWPCSSRGRGTTYQIYLQTCIEHLVRGRPPNLSADMYRTFGTWQATKFICRHVSNIWYVAGHQIYLQTCVEHLVRGRPPNLSADMCRTFGTWQATKSICRHVSNIWYVAGCQRKKRKLHEKVPIISSNANKKFSG